MEDLVTSWPICPQASPVLIGPLADAVEVGLVLSAVELVAEDDGCTCAAATDRRAERAVIDFIARCY